MDDWLHAYVDETGTNVLDTSKSGVSKYFICIAVIVDSNEVDKLTRHLDTMAHDLSSGGEIASKNIRNNHKRRQKFLDRLSGQKFSYFGMLIRKDEVPKESGLRYKQPFYKCINKMLYSEVTKSGRPVKIIADTIGGKDFMDSFDSYLKRQMKPDLFFQYDHCFADSGASRIIQLADLIAGTLAQCFEPDKQPIEAHTFRESLQPFELGIDVWPPVDFHEVDQSGQERPQNSLLTEALNRRVQRFISEHENSKSENELIQVTVLRMLLFAKEFEPAGNKVISTNRLIHSVKEQGYKELSKRAFTESIIGGIRQKGIIIAGTKQGYKLAFKDREIKEYLDHNRSIIEPMLSRLAEARRTVKLDTANEFDIFEDKQYGLLRRLVDSSTQIDNPEDGAGFGE